LLEAQWHGGYPLAGDAGREDRCAETESNHTSKYLFDRNVSQKYIAFLFATYAGTDPMFYGGGGSSDFGSGSGVPRRPIKPQRSGGTAKPLPE